MGEYHVATGEIAAPMGENRVPASEFRPSMGEYHKITTKKRFLSCTIPLRSIEIFCHFKQACPF